MTEVLKTLALENLSHSIHFDFYSKIGSLALIPNETLSKTHFKKKLNANRSHQLVNDHIRTIQQNTKNGAGF